MTDERVGPAVATSLVLTLALQSAVPPFATDTYTPAFPHVVAELSTTAGADTVLVYGGSLAPETVRTAAEGLTDQIRTLREETP